jgi:hypothetical protein
MTKQAIWSKQTGEDGAPGVGIKETKTEYGISDSETSEPSKWYSSIAAIPNDLSGAYLWTRVTTSYTDNREDSVFYTISYSGKDADLGY